MHGELLYRFAEATKIPVGSGDGKLNNVPTLDSNAVFVTMLNTVYFFIGVSAIISIIVGGIMYATSAGDPNQITKAKNIILYAIVGLVVSISAFTITTFVTGRIG